MKGTEIWILKSPIDNSHAIVKWVHIPSSNYFISLNFVPLSHKHEREIMEMRIREVISFCLQACRQAICKISYEEGEKMHLLMCRRNITYPPHESSANRPSLSIVENIYRSGTM